MDCARLAYGSAALVGICLVPVVLAPAATAAPAASDASLTVVHGVRGLVADVRLDGKLVLSGFAPERVTDPLSLTAGSHHLQVWPTSVSPGTMPLVDKTFTITAGEHATAALGVASGQRTTVTVYDDKTLLPNAGATALAVRGLADADNVKVVASGRTIAEALGSGQQAVQQVSPGTYAVSARAAATVVPAQDVPVAAGRAVVLYLIGSQANSTLSWVAQTVRPTASAAAPRRVNTGEGPLPPTPDRGPWAALLLLPVGLFVLAARGIARRRPV